MNSSPNKLIKHSSANSHGDRASKSKNGGSFSGFNPQATEFVPGRSRLFIKAKKCSEPHEVIPPQSSSCKHVFDDIAVIMLQDTDLLLFYHVQLASGVDYRFDCHVADQTA